jgi:predicted nucleic acid-binding protein
MTKVYVDATTLVALGTVGELELLTAFDGDVVLLDSVREEVTTEPARTNLERFVDEQAVLVGPVDTDRTATAQRVLGTDGTTSDVRVVEALLEATAGQGDERPESVGLVSDDRRLRTVAEGLGVTVTGTFGVVVRAASADKYFSADQAKRIVRRIDSHGLHLTGELREQTLGSM